MKPATGAICPTFHLQEVDMKRALGFVLLALSLTGCAVRARYYSDPYWRYHDRDEHRQA
jgi:hypothetical protein